MLEENWYYAGSNERGRNYAPAVLEWDPETLQLIREEYWQGCLQSPRYLGHHPAITEFDPLLGVPTKRVWLENHEKHRDDNLPAVEFLKDGKPIRHEFWVHGQLQRDDGPPIVEFNPNSGEIIRTAEALEMERPSVSIPKPKIPGLE